MIIAIIVICIIASIVLDRLIDFLVYRELEKDNYVDQFFVEYAKYKEQLKEKGLETK